MAPESAHPFPKLYESVIDGRLGSPFFRREQLHRLHQTLLRNKETILEGVIKNSGNTREEALAELYLTLSDIKHFHDERDPKDELDLEYRVAHEQDAATARVAIGIAVITPQAHTLLNSTISPLCAAIAAGNCVVVVIEKTLRRLPTLVSDILRESLDPGVFEIATSNVDTTHLSMIHVNQNDNTPSGPRNVLASPSTSLAVAIVDRTANLEQAAQFILKARVSFSGQSPYAPDLVLVNEFSKKEFLRHLLHHSAEYLTLGGDAKLNEAQRSREATPASQKATGKGFRKIMSGSGGSIVDFEDRRFLRNLEKTLSKTIKIHTFTSLEDAIEAANEIQPAKLLAAYTFGDSPSSKYMLQFVDASVGFANALPTEILIGPAAPCGYATSLSPRYASTLFSTPYPKYSTATGPSTELSQILSCDYTGIRQEKLWKTVGLKEREPIKNILGYFERGAIVGASTRLISLLSLGALGYFVTRKFFLPKFVG